MTDNMANNEAILEELAQLYEEHGTLRAEDVVEFAQDESTALHSEFEWDDSEAARQYRLEQARKIIRINVNILPTRNGNVTVPVYVSLVQDRSQPGGGYRRLVDVMSDDEMREQLLQQALAEFQRVGRRYRALQELAPVFTALDRVTRRMQRQASRT
jgi:hypothetical protein